MSEKKIVRVALTGLFALSAAALTLDSAEARKGMEKCTGVAEAGKNDCGANDHTCAGKAAGNYDKNEWKWVKEGTCKDLQANLRKDKTERKAPAGKEKTERKAKPRG